MLKIGLTGGIGSGKSTVADLFSHHGATIIDADQISHSLTEPGNECFQKIIEHFGKKYIRQDGRLNRALLREIIFSDKSERQWLEQLLHPKIREQMLDVMLSIDALYCIAVVPLLVESNLLKLFDRILVVDTTEELQLQRSDARDSSSRSKIKQIIHSQCTPEARLNAADDVISNNGSLEDLKKQVDKLDRLYRNYTQRG